MSLRGPLGLYLEVTGVSIYCLSTFTLYLQFIKEKAVGGPRRAIYLISRLHRAHGERWPPCLTRANVSALHVWAGRWVSGLCLEVGNICSERRDTASLSRRWAGQSASSPCVAGRVEQSIVRTLLGKLDLGLLEHGAELHVQSGFCCGHKNF